MSNDNRDSIINRDDNSSKESSEKAKPDRERDLFHELMKRFWCIGVYNCDDSRG